MIFNYLPSEAQDWKGLLLNRRVVGTIEAGELTSAGFWRSRTYREEGHECMEVEKFPPVENILWIRKDWRRAGVNITDASIPDVCGSQIQ
jgi:hypothetical protein